MGLLVNLSVSLMLALILGLVTHRLRLSRIVGYLLAGIALGEATPGFDADPHLAAELAEIGVVLLMFGVGLHFNLGELLAVRRIALPGAAAQITVATALGILAAWLGGLDLAAGIVMGVAISVASTVVLIRVLMDNDVLHTSQGHIAVGWLIVEDIFTVLVLVAMPALASAFGQEGGEDRSVVWALGLAVVKVVALGIVVMAGGRIVIPWLLRQVARTRSRELFTLTVLALALAIATGSALGFGVSMALGAFLAGMVVGQTEVSHQVGADALPMRDAFAVLFFVAVGMLFDPQVLVDRPGLLLAISAIVLLAKPLTAFFIVWLLRYSVRSALTIAVALAQIGEFSFLLADEAKRDGLLPADGHSLLVACAILSITLNPLLFRAIDPVEQWLRRRPNLWRWLTSRSEAGGADLNLKTQTELADAGGDEPQPDRAVIVGFGPVGQTSWRVLNDFGVQTVVVDLNLDTVRQLAAKGGLAIYGDATQRDILHAAGIRGTTYLLVTVPEMLARTVVILAAREMNPDLLVFTRARYIQEQAWLAEVGATAVIAEEAQTALAFAAALLREVGAPKEHIERETDRIDRELYCREASDSTDESPVNLIEAPPGVTDNIEPPWSGSRFQPTKMDQ